MKKLYFVIMLLTCILFGQKIEAQTISSISGTSPGGLMPVFDNSCNMYFYKDGYIKKMAANGSGISNIAGTGTAGYNSAEDGGPSLSAQIDLVGIYLDKVT